MTSKVCQGQTCVVHRRYTAIVNYKKMVKILHRELKRKFEKVKHMKLEVMQRLKVILISGLNNP